MPSRPPHSGNRKKILVYLFGSLGDSLVAIPALRAVRRHFGEAELVMLQNFESDELVLAEQVMPSGLISRYLSYKSRGGRLEKIREYYKLWRMLRRERFDAAAYLIMSERPARSVSRDRAFFRSAGITDLFGFHPIADEDLYPREHDGHPALTDHEAVHKLKRLALDGIEYSKKDLAVPLLEFGSEESYRMDQWLAERRIRPEIPLISIAPGCKSHSNLWPFKNFARLGKMLTDHFECEIVVTGGPSEKEDGDRLIGEWGFGINAAGEFSVRDSALLLSKCTYHVGLDTGTMHLAAAAGTRCFIVFGERSNPGLWYPLGNGHTIVYHRVACAGCHTQVCPVPGHPCMTGVKVEEVWEHLEQFLGEGPSVNAPTKVIAV